MNRGRIMVGKHDGVYVLKLLGDIRVNLCATLDGQLKAILEHDDFDSLLVDMTDTEGIDSTSLGLLARLSMAARKRHQQVPAMLSTNPDITRIVRTTGFDDVFDIIEDDPSAGSEEGTLGEVPAVPATEDVARRHVLEAHRTLMQMNAANREEFRELVNALESGSA